MNEILTKYTKSEKWCPKWKDNTQSSGVRLHMLEDGALESGQLNKMVDVFIGSAGKYLAAYKGGDMQQIDNHEERFRARYLRYHPETNEEEYARIRDEQREKSDKRAYKRVNERFERAVAERFDVPRDPMGFAGSRLIDAGNTMSDTASNLAPDEPNIHPRNEAVLLSENPAETVIKLASPDSKVDPVLKKEIIRQHLLAFIAAEHKRTNGRKEAEKKLSRIHDLLSAKLFELPQGGLVEQKFTITFDDITNGVREIDGTAYDDPSLNPTHVTEMQYLMRPIKDSTLHGLVEVDRKEMGTAVNKAIKKAQKIASVGGSDLITAGPSAIQDTHRMQIVIDGSLSDRAEITQRIQEILEDPENQNYIADKNSNGDPAKDVNGLIKGSVLKAELDNETNGYESQADVDFDRLQVYIAGLTAPIEIKIVTLKDYLEDKYHVGLVNEESGREVIKARAHDIYEHRRLEDVALYVLGDRVQEPKIRRAIMEQRKRIKKRLLDATR